MGDTFRIDLKLGGIQAPSAQSPADMLLALPAKQKIINLTNNIVAVFVETANIAAAPVDITTVAGVIKRQTVTTTRTEQGAGKTMLKNVGAIIIVEPNDPTIASSGYVGVKSGVLAGTTGTQYRLTNGIHTIADAAAPAITGDIALALDFDTGVAVNKKATVYLLGQT